MGVFNKLVVCGVVYVYDTLSSLYHCILGSYCFAIRNKFLFRFL